MTEQLLCVDRCIHSLYFWVDDTTGTTEKPSEECSAQPGCPLMCRCTDGVVDCRDKGLTRIPPYLPDTATELYLYMLSF